MKLTLFIFAAILASAYCDCGCLKCSKNLRVVSSPRSPCKIIYRGVPCEHQRPLSYTIQAPVIAPPVVSIPKSYDYKIQAVDFISNEEEQPLVGYSYQVQTPIIAPPPPLSLPLTGLVSRTDRMVMPAPSDCRKYDHDNVLKERRCNPIFPQAPQYQFVAQPQQQQIAVPLQYLQKVNRGPIIEKLSDDFFRRVGCDCRYDSSSTRTRNKRHLPLVTNPVHWFMTLIPRILHLPMKTLHNLHRSGKSLKAGPRYHNEKVAKITPEQMKMLHYYERMGRRSGNEIVVPRYYPNSVGTLVRNGREVLEREKNQNLGYSVLKTGKKRVVPVENSVIDKDYVNFPQYCKHQNVEPLVLARNYEKTVRKQFAPVENNVIDKKYVNFPQYCNHQNVVPSVLARNYKKTARKQVAPVENNVIDKNYVNFPQYYNHQNVVPSVLARNYEKKLRKQVVPVKNNVIDKNYVNFPQYYNYQKVVPSVLARNEVKPSETSFLSKLIRLNRPEIVPRPKRSIVLDENGELSLPFLRITDLESSDESSEDDSSEETARQVKLARPSREEYLDPLNFENLIPHNPIFYILNAPIRLLHHFHKFGEQISPVFKSVPDVLINSKKYLRDFSKTVKNDVLNFASHLIGDFDETPYSSHRFRRDISNSSTKVLEPFEPEYSRAFPETIHSRPKRYILKVVDEDEVETFLREKLGTLVDTQKPKKPERAKKSKLVVEKLNSKIIIDNNGRAFVEINGVKRPLHLRKPLKNDEVKVEKKNETVADSAEQTINEKISSVIERAREKLDSGGKTDGVALHQNEVSLHIIKQKINQILNEIQHLVNLDFAEYLELYGDLAKLQSFKTNLVNGWKRSLIEYRQNDINSKITILNGFRELQTLRDAAVARTARILDKDCTFMTKNLIRILVRLQKLQCLIHKVVETFGETLKVGGEFSVSREIKFVEYLSGLDFVQSGTSGSFDIERDLRDERDRVLERELELLEKLRRLVAGNDGERVYAEAKVLWEINNVEKLQKAAVGEMNVKIGRGQRVRKEMKILFDLLRQMEACEEKQGRVLGAELKNERKRKSKSGCSVCKEGQRKSGKFENENNVIYKNNGNERKFLSRTILEDKKPVKLVSNGYTMTAYKVSDGFN